VQGKGVGKRREGKKGRKGERKMRKNYCKLGELASWG